MEKLYCYIDESGQDTQGELFIVAVVITGDERDGVFQLCETIERATGKGRVKWYEAQYERCLAYMRRILQEPILQGKLNVVTFRNAGQDYLQLTVQAVAEVVLAHSQEPYSATVLIDGLPRSKRKVVGARLRHLGVRVRKVRGVRKEENDALILLADALCGFVRAAREGQGEMQRLFGQAKTRGFITAFEP